MISNRRSYTIISLVIFYCSILSTVFQSLVNLSFKDIYGEYTIYEFFVEILVTKWRDVESTRSGWRRKGGFTSSTFDVRLFLLVIFARKGCVIDVNQKRRFHEEDYADGRVVILDAIIVCFCHSFGSFFYTLLLLFRAKSIYSAFFFFFFPCFVSKRIILE